jgi:hypothetical protein
MWQETAHYVVEEAVFVLSDLGGSLHSAIPKRCDSERSPFPKAATLLASVAQLAEQLICNQPVAGSNPSAGSWEEFP